MNAIVEGGYTNFYFRWTKMLKTKESMSFFCPCGKKLFLKCEEGAAQNVVFAFLQLLLEKYENKRNVFMEVMTKEPVWKVKILKD